MSVVPLDVRARRSPQRSQAPSSPTHRIPENAMATELHPPADADPAPPRSGPVRFVDLAALEVLPGQGGMVPPAEALPLVLPTDRLNARGMAVPAVRQQFRTIHDLRNVGNVVSVWLQSFGLIALVCWLTP